MRMGIGSWLLGRWARVKVRVESCDLSVVGGGWWVVCSARSGEWCLAAGAGAEAGARAGADADAGAWDDSVSLPDCVW